ncbi:MAG: ABC transporter substrate-binding protein [Sphingomonadales bacterium]
MKAAGWYGILFGLLAALSPPSAEAAPRRIVSMGLCTDQLVMLLADPDTILSVHWVTQEAEDSAMWKQAARYVPNHGLAEEVLKLRPDMVFADGTNSPLTIDMLKRQGATVVTVPVANTFAGVRSNIREVAAALGERERGEALVASFDAGLAKTRGALADLHYRSLVYGANGFSAGIPSLFNDVLNHVGLDNIAARPGQSGWVNMSVEDVLRAEPQLLILGEYRMGSPSMANLVLEHPAIDAMRRDRPVVSIPTSLWNCGTPWLVQATETLRDQVRQVAGPGR